jgi:hypothetical protein
VRAVAVGAGKTAFKPGKLLAQGNALIESAAASICVRLKYVMAKRLMGSLDGMVRHLQGQRQVMTTKQFSSLWNL